MALRRTAFAVVMLLVVSCGTTSDALAARRRSVSPAPPAWNNEWARGAVFYEIFVRSFSDSDGDGIGDFNGLISKFDYLHDLGIDAIWLMPVFESPSYHGYDTTDYETIEKDYGTNADFQRFLDEAHKRGMKVIVDFVMNHTSNEHPWFIESASSPTSPRRDWYIWSATNPGWTQPWGPDPTWHPQNGAYYYGVFWSGMPDLNYRNAAVKQEMFRLARLWLSRGVDGFRLDATRYLIEDGPGSGQYDTPETHDLLKEFSDSVRFVKPSAFVVAENTVSTALLATYFHDVNSSFDFPLATAIIDGVSHGSASPIRSTLQSIAASYPTGAIDTPFLTNHDQTRIATVLGDPSKLRAAASILLTLPGAPFIYYGEEIGMQNGPTSADESKRTPMAWTSTGGFTTGKPWFDYSSGVSTANVASETNEPQSLLSYYRNWIATRKRSDALLKGDLVLLDADSHVLVYTRNTATDHVVVAHNLSGAAVAVDVPNLGAPLFVDDGVTTDAFRIVLPPYASGVWRYTSAPHNNL